MTKHEKPAPRKRMTQAERTALSDQRMYDAAMKLIAQEKPTLPVTGYCALAENMPDSGAVRLRRAGLEPDRAG